MSVLWVIVTVIFRPAAEAQHFAFSTFGQAFGLTNLNVSTLLQDRHGAIWVGTESGVFLADGTRFIKQRTFDKVHLELTRAMQEDADGRIWVMDNRHLTYWKDGTVRSIDQLNLKLLTAEGAGLISLLQDQRVSHAAVVENERLGHALRIIKAAQDVKFIPKVKTNSEKIGYRKRERKTEAVEMTA